MVCYNTVLQTKSQVPQTSHKSWQSQVLRTKLRSFELVRATRTRYPRPTPAPTSSCCPPSPHARPWRSAWTGRGVRRQRSGRTDGQTDRLIDTLIDSQTLTQTQIQTGGGVGVRAVGVGFQRGACGGLLRNVGGTWRQAGACSSTYGHVGAYSGMQGHVGACCIRGRKTFRRASRDTFLECLWGFISGLLDVTCRRQNHRTSDLPLHGVFQRRQIHKSQLPTGARASSSCRESTQPRVSESASGSPCSDEARGEDNSIHFL